MSRVGDLAAPFLRVPSEKAVPGRKVAEPALFGPAVSNPGGRIGNRDARRHSEAYGGTDAIAAVMDCVDLYAQTASNAEYHFEKTNGRTLRFPGEKPGPNTEGIVPASLANLFERPNRIMDYTEMMELSVIDFLLCGEFFWIKHGIDGLGRPAELYRIAPKLMDVVPGKTAPDGYIYRVPSGPEMKLKPDEVIHVKRPNPHSPWRGLGVIAGDPRMYDIAIAATESMAQYYEQGTRLSGVLESERSIPTNTFQKIKGEFMALYTGKQNHQKVAFLERGLKFRPISGHAGEADYKGSRELGRAEIAMAFKTPLPLLGAVGNADRQAVKESQRIFDNKVMRPFLNRIQRQVTYQLIQPAFDLKYIIDHEYVIPYEDKLDLGQALAAIPGVRVREVRDLIDLEPLSADDPDLAWIDDAVLNLPGQDREDGGHPDQPLASEGGRPPKGNKTVLFPRKAGDVPGSADIIPGGTAVEAQKAIQEALSGTH